MKLRAYGTMVLAAASSLWMMSGSARERPVLTDAASAPVRALEAKVSAHPGDVQDTRALAQVYLDARQPGLAIVLVEGAPTAVRGDVRVEHVYARALIDEGRNGEALDVEASVVGACRALSEGNVGAFGCDPVLLASAMRRSDILRELLSLGIEDARAQPEASRVAYRNATREARVVLE